MKLFKALFNKGEKPNKVQELMKITNAIGPLLDKTAHEIFVSHSTELLAEPVTYIISAVWGTGNEGGLTPTQVNMNKKIMPVIDEILRLFETRKMTPPQRNAVDYLLRGFLISKITFMIELFKNQTLLSAAAEYNARDSLEEIEPIGSA